MYTIQQNLPSKSAGYLSSYKIEDTISKYWQVSEIKVTDEANTDQTKNFDYTIAQADAGSKLQITAKTSALNNVDFYGHFYNFNIMAVLLKMIKASSFPVLPSSSIQLTIQVFLDSLIKQR